MTKDEVLALAREVWDTPHWNETQTKRLERFAALVAAHEREECARVCEAEGQRIDASWSSCAAAIRGRT